MNKGLILGLSMTAASTVVFAQQPGGVQMQSSNKSGTVQIQGNTNINANAQNTGAVASGQGNKAKNTVGGITGQTQIQGNTKINANAKNTQSVASGKGNQAESAVGSIGK